MNEHMAFLYKTIPMKITKSRLLALKKTSFHHLTNCFRTRRHSKQKEVNVQRALTRPYNAEHEHDMKNNMNTTQIHKYIKIVWIKENTCQNLYNTLILKHDMIRKKKKTTCIL